MSRVVGSGFRKTNFMARGGYRPAGHRQLTRYSWKGKYQRDRSPGMRHGGGHPTVSSGTRLPISSSVTALLFFPPAGRRAEHACPEEPTHARQPAGQPNRSRTADLSACRPGCSFPTRPPSLSSGDARSHRDGWTTKRHRPSARRAGQREAEPAMKSTRPRGPAPPARATGAMLRPAGDTLASIQFSYNNGMSSSSVMPP
ncbi:hypothetical protein SETIT_9G415600v2 [Setaria italica]|uniref:Uncharacterized protein n=1 Tax=Setaria italica TaxID=4555 RepID=A0A368SRB2_SETIT|nr:hypothetical protein SETIT_9G415600v2 [Setaria italica]